MIQVFKENDSTTIMAAMLYVAICYNLFFVKPTIRVRANIVIRIQNGIHLKFDINDGNPTANVGTETRNATGPYSSTASISTSEQRQQQEEKEEEEEEEEPPMVDAEIIETAYAEFVVEEESHYSLE